MNDRRRWFICALIALGAAVVAVCLFAGFHRQAGDEAEQESVSAPPPVLSHTAAGLVVVILSKPEQARIGLEVEALRSSARSRELTGYGVVLDPGALITLNAQIASARAVLDASRAEFERTKFLHAHQQNISLKDLETAQARFHTDEAQFDRLNQQLADQWGEEIAAMTPDKRGALISALVRRTVALIRVSLPTGQSPAAVPGWARVTVLGFERQPLTTRRVWIAPAVDPMFQGQSYLLEVAEGKFPLRPGAAVSAAMEMQTPQRRGVVVPDSAVVRTDDHTWVYAQITPTRFERRRIALTQPAARGWFVTAGFAPGDRIVVTGAQALLSRELQSQIRTED
jgi:hypothetical protein